MVPKPILPTLWSWQTGNRLFCSIQSGMSILYNALPSFQWHAATGWNSFCTAASSVPTCIQRFTSFQSVYCSVSIKKRNSRDSRLWFPFTCTRCYLQQDVQQRQKLCLDIWPFWCSAVTEWALPVSVAWLKFQDGEQQKMSLQSAAAVKHARCKKCLNHLIKDHQFPSCLQHLAVCACPRPRCYDNLTWF